jgi:hypothetical protein
MTRLGHHRIGIPTDNRSVDHHGIGEGDVRCGLLEVLVGADEQGHELEHEQVEEVRHGDVGALFEEGQVVAVPL